MQFYDNANERMTTLFKGIQMKYKADNMASFYITLCSQQEDQVLYMPLTRKQHAKP